MVSLKRYSPVAVQVVQELDEINSGTQDSRQPALQSKFPKRHYWIPGGGGHYQQVPPTPTHPWFFLAFVRLGKTGSWVSGGGRGKKILFIHSLIHSFIFC